MPASYLSSAVRAGFFKKIGGRISLFFYTLLNIIARRRSSSGHMRSTGIPFQPFISDNMRGSGPGHKTADMREPSYAYAVQVIKA